MSFAVIDFETTGFVPERADRVIEVGIVLTDVDGQIEHEWSTLVNPHRDISASFIHHVVGADLLDAPDFADISGHVLELLTGRVVVAHNAVFDMRFLQCELQRADYVVPERPIALCSMRWAGRLIGAAKLAQCCEALGIALDHAHSALCDARATAQLLPFLLDACRDTVEWLADLQRSAAYPWPAPLRHTAHVAAVQRGVAAAHPNEWLHTVLRAAWIPGHPEDEAAYLLVLEKALLDRAISRTEGRQLVETAESAGLTPATADRLHQKYLRAVAAEALEDGVVTDAERQELASIAAALGFTDTHIDEALSWAASHTAEVARESEFVLRSGDRVVFTGDMARSREEWIATVVAAGLTTGGVTKSTRVLVAADPDSISGKAAKARAYGIPVISEEAFERMLGRFRGET